MKINNEEIERLMRVLAESLRLRWEKAMIHGRSLLIVQQEIETALIKISQNDTKGKRILKLMCGLGVLFMLALTYPSRWDTFDHVWVTVIRGISFLAVIGCFVWLWYLDKTRHAALQNISDCDKIFARLKRSVDTLNCLGQGNPYWDIIDESLVIERLVRAAYRVLDAQAFFEKIRLIPDVDRNGIIHAGNWIGHCEGVFDQIWNVATHDFGLELDKGEIFKQASTELTKDNLKRASVKS